MTVDVAHLVEAVVVAIVAFAGVWGGLRMTVSGLKEDVRTVKAIVTVVEVLRAKQQVDELETEKLRTAMHDARARIQDLLIRVGRAETLIDEARRDIEETKP